MCVNIFIYIYDHHYVVTAKFEEEVRGRVTNCCFSHSRATPDELAMEYGVPAGTFN